MIQEFASLEEVGFENNRGEFSREFSDVETGVGFHRRLTIPTVYEILVEMRDKTP